MKQSIPPTRSHTDFYIYDRGRIMRFKNIPQPIINAVLALASPYEEKWTNWPHAEEWNFKKCSTQSAYMVRLHRCAKKLSQARLANQLCISQANLSKIESGKRAVGKNLAKRLGEVLNTDYRIFL